ncbi:MAG: hypothetical protein K2X93_18640 [Candidatus Obscuribacterales bacterium]|nr:hypothetical protein [Candidatus Obscuribacterales bacterium]
MRLAGCLILVTVISVLFCEQAEARWFRSYRYDAQEIGRQQRANMAERTHQKKELLESARLEKEREHRDRQGTVQNYQWNSTTQRPRGKSALVHKVRQCQRRYY